VSDAPIISAHGEPEKKKGSKRSPARCRKREAIMTTTLDYQYCVQFVPIDSIKPSPENIELYGEIKHDGQMTALIESIKDHGLGEPVLVTADGYIVSGHRRYFAVRKLGWKEVPVIVRKDVNREGNRQYHKLLVAFNPQRVKTVGTVLMESLLRDTPSSDAYAALRDRSDAAEAIDVQFMGVAGSKGVNAITEKKLLFLEAVQRVVNDLERYWPVSIRQVHYRLLNDPPLTSVPKRSKFDPERYRYRNDQ